MLILNRLIPLTLLALVAIALSACGAENRTGSGSGSGDKPVASSGDPRPDCLPAGDVSGTLGLEVQEFRAGNQTSGPNTVCAYQGTDNKLGVSVTTIVGPADRAEEVFGMMRESVRLFNGAGAAPDAIEVGERGYAYGGGSKSEAAAVSKGRLYHAEVVSSASADIGDKKVAMVEIVSRLMGQ